MTAADRIYELVKAMPEEQIQEVLAFVEILELRTLTGLRGIAKQRGDMPTDEELREEYTNYLMEKYQ